MKWKIKEKIAVATSIPDELILDTFRVVMTGRELTVENFKGIIEYSPTLIRLRVKGGRLTLEGSGMEIKTAYDDEIQIGGRIAGIKID
ncbi:MAG: YabP/YqfC family sporulation protein [Eubacteriales bacterium]|nr:YabP/YqfC family sporulation protein [Eubacteriales bacterium]